MRIMLFSFCLFFLAACQSPNVQAKEVKYDSHRHKLGSDADWNNIRKSILFHSAFESPQLLKAAGTRTSNFDAATILHALHSWFTEGAGYFTGYEGDEKYLVLRTIPEQALSEIFSRMSASPTGFGFLDLKFWQTIHDLQTKKFTIAVIAHATSPIGGLNIAPRRFIAFDVFADSGTLVHELRHQQQFEAISGKAKYFEIFPSDHDCHGALSYFFGEFDATTVQLPEWVQVFSHSKVNVEDIVQYEQDGGAISVPSTMTSLGANLEYPINAASSVLASEEGASCSEETLAIVRQIQKIAMRQEEQILSSKEALVFKGSLRRETAALLRTQSQCQSNCDHETARLKEIKETIDKAKDQIVKKLEDAYRERIEETQKLISELEPFERLELCDTVRGIATMTDCGEVK